MSWSIHEGDCRQVLCLLHDNSVDACVTDPPYELGFMGKKWDASGIAYSVELWREVLRVLKPGAHLLAFGGTRTYHRMACAIEDAGFEIRDSVLWLYGSGFPKSLNIGDGRGTALKPAHEPIVMARKPLAGTVARNVEKWGTGAINVDACRISTADDLNGGAYSGEERKRDNYSSIDTEADASLTRLRRGIGEYSQPAGRWPANVILDEFTAGELDKQSGMLKSGAHAAGTHMGEMGYHGADGYSVPPRDESEGGASRFFYVAKPATSERDAGLDHLSARSGGEATGRKDNSAGLNSPRAGAGRRGGRKNIHPTVKPIELMRYLCKLVTPPNGLVLDPFTGSGTTGVAALAEGFRFVGIEREAEYIEIARARIEEDAPLFNRRSAK